MSPPSPVLGAVLPIRAPFRASTVGASSRMLPPAPLPDVLALTCDSWVIVSRLVALSEMSPEPPAPSVLDDSVAPFVTRNCAAETSIS